MDFRAANGHVCNLDCSGNGRRRSRTVDIRNGYCERQDAIWWQSRVGCKANAGFGEVVNPQGLDASVGQQYFRWPVRSDSSLLTGFGHSLSRRGWRRRGRASTEAIKQVINIGHRRERSRSRGGRWPGCDLIMRRCDSVHVELKRCRPGATSQALCIRVTLLKSNKVCPDNEDRTVQHLGDVDLTVRSPALHPSRVLWHDHHFSANLMRHASRNVRIRSAWRAQG